MKKNIKQKSTFGIGLLELMLALAIIAILLVMATRYFETTRGAQQINQALQMLQTTMTASDNWYTTYKSYRDTPKGDVDITKLADLGLVPKDFTTDTINPWGGKISVTPKDNDHVNIELTAVPAGDCKYLVDIMTKRHFTAVCSETTFTLTYP
jgi:Tfp pilus assembly protein PilE